MSAIKKKKTQAKSHMDMDDYLPYAAHFDEETIVTKNGELMQTIKVCGFSYEFKKDQQTEIKSLRESIREALIKHIPSDNFSVWVHTIRRQQDLTKAGGYSDNFSNNLNEKWIKQNGWRTEYINELYVSILIEGEWLPFKSAKFFIDSLFVHAELTKRSELLKESAKQLSSITDSVVADLANFGARKLSIYKEQGVYYSEQMALISKLMNLKEEKIPLLPRNLCHILPTHNVEFLINTVHVEGPTGRHFGSIFSVKQYREIDLEELDKLIQLPINLMVSECFDFVKAELALEAFEDQKKCYEISGSKFMMKASGLNDVYENLGEGKSTDFVRQQIVITIIEDSIKAMQNSVSDAIDICRDIGLVVVREDLFLENCYWASMPANFDFLLLKIPRQNYIPLKRTCGFASLANFTTGRLENIKWQYPVSVFRTSKKKPFIFNFHNDDAGNTAILGAVNEQKNSLVNFLICQSQKFNGHTIILEKSNKSEVFVKSLGGEYLKPSVENFNINNKVSGLNLSDKSENDILAILKNICGKLDFEKQNIVVLDEEICKTDSIEFTSYLENIVDDLNQKNCVVIFLAEDVSRKIGIFTKNIQQKLTNKIFLPQPTADDDLLLNFAMRESELKNIRNLDANLGEFLIKRAGETIKLSFKFNEDSAELKIISNANEFIESMKQAAAENSAVPNNQNNN